MAEAVIDLLEMIGVDEQERALPASRHRLAQGGEEAPAVQQAGHAVAPRLLDGRRMGGRQFAMCLHQLPVQPRDLVAGLAKALRLPEPPGAHGPGNQ